MRFAEPVKCWLNVTVASYGRWKAITALANSLEILLADVSPKFLLLAPSTSIFFFLKAIIPPCLSKLQQQSVRLVL